MRLFSCDGFLSRVLAICVVCMSALTLSANHNFHGEKTLGVRAGYAGYNKSAVAGAEFSYRFNRWLRVAPNANYVFRRSGADALTVNLNVQFPLNFSLDRMAVYPEVGLGFASWNYHGARSAGYDDASTRVSRIGLNLGLGYEIDLTPQLRMGVVGEYLVIRRYHGFNALMSVAYRF